jgi:50S ribosomal subunit-associated GTPase HflX
VKDRLLAQSLVAAHPGALGVSARSGAGIAALAARVTTIVQSDHEELDIRVPAGAGRLLAYIEGHAEVLSRAYDGDVAVMRIRASPRDAARIDEDLRAATRRK